MDSNTVIDYLGNILPAKGADFIDRLPALISVITRMEIVGWYNATNEQLVRLKSFADGAQIFAIEEEVILHTISIRQQHKIKLPDAIIAATAVTNKLILITRNTNDYKNINGLRLLNPWEI